MTDGMLNNSNSEPEKSNSEPEKSPVSSSALDGILQEGMRTGKARVEGIALEVILSKKIQKLEDAIKCGDSDKVNDLVSENSSLLGTRSNPPILTAILQTASNPSCLKQLLELGADPDYAGAYSPFSPIGMATLLAESSMVSLLIEHGANISRTSNNPYEAAPSPLCFATILGLEDITKILEDAGASLSEEDTKFISMHSDEEISQLRQELRENLESYRD